MKVTSWHDHSIFVIQSGIFCLLFFAFFCFFRSIRSIHSIPRCRPLWFSPCPKRPYTIGQICCGCTKWLVRKTPSVHFARWTTIQNRMSKTFTQGWWGHYHCTESGSQLVDWFCATCCMRFLSSNFNLLFLERMCARAIQRFAAHWLPHQGWLNSREFPQAIFTLKWLTSPFNGMNVKYALAG